MTRVRVRAKAPRFGAGDGGTCLYHYPLGGIVVGILSVTGFRVKTLARSCELGDDGVVRRYPLGGVVEEPRLIWVQHVGVLPWREAFSTSAWRGAVVSYLLHVFSVLLPRSSLCTDRIGAPRPGAREQTALFGDSLVC